VRVFSLVPEEQSSRGDRDTVAPKRVNFLLRWWREATGPLLSNDHPLLVDALLRRLWVLSPVILLALILAGALGFHLFTGWRARDLTAKALASAEAGSWHFARRQVAAAANLRPEHPAVKLAGAVIESRLGNPEAVAMWEEFAEGTVLNGDEIDARAEIMTAHGDDAQFETAVAALEAQGASGRAAELRSRRSLRRGNLEQAIAQARAAAAASDDPALRLRLLQLLSARHGTALARRAAGPRDLAAAAEMTALVDGLAGTTAGDEALALGLEAPYFPAAKKAGWAEAAWRNPSEANPALLPASAFLAASGKETPAALYDKLQGIYTGAPPPRQAALAGWLLRHGMNAEVLAAISGTEAAQHTALFGLRVSALGALGRWEEASQLAEAPGEVPESVRLMVKASAARELGRPGEADELVRTALRISVAEDRFGPTVDMADRQGLPSLADEAILDLCANGAEADRAFGLARDRFGRRGQFATLDQAYAAARQASPAAVSVLAYERYRDLLDGGKIDPSLTAEALAARPTDVVARFNHALALFKAGQANEALAVFDDFDVLTSELPPGLQAVSAALLDAAGDPGARALVRGINPDLLTPGEYALIAPLRHAGP
jgi:hypothetical protein